MRLVPVHYLGSLGLDRHFSGPMLPWVVAEIRRKEHCSQICLGVEDGCAKAYDPDFEEQFVHKIDDVTRFSQADSDPTLFLYLLRNDDENVLYCHLFQASKETDVSDLYQQMKEGGALPQGATRSASSAANLTSLCVDISPSSSHFFEVFYVGKIRVSHKKVPDTFIEDAVEKFRLHEQEKGTIGRLVHTKSEESLRRGSQDSSVSDSGSVDSFQEGCIPTPLSPSTPSRILSAPRPSDVENLTYLSKSADCCARGEFLKPASLRKISEEADGQMVRQHLDPRPEPDDHNRTMVLQVGRGDLRLISPDRKQILLHKQHKDIATCLQGVRMADHFGFIAREGSVFMGYIFKCESRSVASDAVNAISQAYASQESRPAAQRQPLTSCEHCPMVWYHKLCLEIENLSDRKTQAAILRRLEQLDDEDQASLLAKFKSSSADAIRDQNEFLMILLRAHCEAKQSRHVHDTAENRSEFLNQYLGGSSAIFMKAKRSLSNSFDHLLKRRGSRDDIAARDMSLPVGGATAAGPCLEVEPSVHKQPTPERSLSSGSLKSPMMDIFLKVGSNPRPAAQEDPTKPKNGTSWRQAIFNRVTTKPTEPSQPTEPLPKRTPRQLWQKAINQAVLLVRMEKENRRLKERQEETAVKRIKLEYDELSSCQKEVVELWDFIVGPSTGGGLKCDHQKLLQAVRQGVPRAKRGEVWSFLADQHSRKLAPVDAGAFPNYNQPYDHLLKQLTSHQHAILIDLGRTFPNHFYYSSPLGPGQLALFNILKAYSLLDPEVGYCQGLSFVAGVLLLHMEESEAYRLLKHLMFRRGLREQYLPDMAALQTRLYQLSRLLRDRLPDLYEHFDRHEIGPALYAAPWLLTVFASQFPLGFVARVFDLMFLESPDVVFRVGLALLAHHKEDLLRCDCFEEVMDYFKGPLCHLNGPTMERVLKEAVSADVARQLNEYKVEYFVLSEEMAAVQPQIDSLHRLEVENKRLVEKNCTLAAQLEAAMANVQRLERNRTLQQSSANKMEAQMRALEVTVATLGTFINGLIEDKVDVDIPGDVRRILGQMTFVERRRSPGLLKTISNGSQMVKSLSTGRLGLGQPPKPLVRSNSLVPETELQEARGAPIRVIDDDKEQQKQKQPVLPKVSSFFSHSHSSILQQKFNGKQPQAQPQVEPSKETPQKELPREKEKSPGDSGVCTPVSTPEQHPLSHCDVNFSFSGTSKLKTIRPAKGS